MAAIDVGGDAINRTSFWGSTYTLVSKNNPANFSGKITSVQIWAAAQLLNCEVAIFYAVSGTNLTTRSNATIGTVNSGSLQTFPVDLDVVAGDYIGLYFTGGAAQIEAASSGGLGLLYAAGDNIPCTNVLFTLQAGYIMSLYGTGIQAPAITSLNPDNGIVGTEVVIAGTDFEAAQGTGGVTVDGVAADIGAWGDTEITITIPDGVSVGDVDVVVTTAHSQVSSAATFTVQPGGNPMVKILRMLAVE